MEISEAAVRHLEALAALRLSDAERARMRGDLSRILEYMEQLRGLDVSEVPPTSHVIESQNVLRDDLVRPSMPLDEVLGNSPDARGGFYRVPRFVGEGGETE